MDRQLFLTYQKFGRLLASGIFLANLNCIPIEESFQQSLQRGDLPPGVESRLCPSDDEAGELDKLAAPEFVTPTRKLSEAELPSFSDDMELSGMDLALDRQLERYRKRNMVGTVVLGGKAYPLTAVKESLEQFRVIAKKAQACLLNASDAAKAACYRELDRSVRSRFDVFVPDLKPGDARYGESQPVLFTGYYTPSLEVTTRTQGDFKHPIYIKPTEDMLTRTGRFMIDFRNQLSNRGLELFYSKSLFDLYLLHMEGGGHVRYKDDKGRPASAYISFAGTNSREWRFISKLMIDKGWISEPTIMAQRDFVSRNPNLHPEIFAYCPGYVYFKLTDHPPEGSDMVPLTDNRSIATDRNHYRFKGLLAFVQAHRPKSSKIVETIPFSRFVLDQDTGGAIKGKNRVDFYFGEGEYAEMAANTLQHRGDLFYLMLK